MIVFFTKTKATSNRYAVTRMH